MEESFGDICYLFVLPGVVIVVGVWRGFVILWWEVHLVCCYDVRLGVRAGGNESRSFNKHPQTSIMSYQSGNKYQLGLVARHLRLIDKTERLLHKLVILIPTLKS